MLGDFFAWIKRMGWIMVILIIIAPVAAGIIFHTALHDVMTWFHASGINFPKAPHKIKIP